jgi:hypothetical protein
MALGAGIVSYSFEPTKIRSMSEREQWLGSVHSQRAGLTIIKDSGVSGVNGLIPFTAGFEVLI